MRFSLTYLKLVSLILIICLESCSYEQVYITRNYTKSPQSCKELNEIFKQYGHRTEFLNYDSKGENICPKIIVIKSPKKQKIIVERILDEYFKEPFHQEKTED